MKTRINKKNAERAMALLAKEEKSPTESLFMLYSDSKEGRQSVIANGTDDQIAIAFAVLAFEDNDFFRIIKNAVRATERMREKFEEEINNTSKGLNS